MKVGSKELSKIMNIAENRQYIVMQDVLSSGAEVFICVKLPPE